MAMLIAVQLFEMQTKAHAPGCNGKNIVKWS